MMPTKIENDNVFKLAPSLTRSLKFEKVNCPLEINAFASKMTSGATTNSDINSTYGYAKTLLVILNPLIFVTSLEPIFVMYVFILFPLVLL
jgi:hypothetical protein